MKRWGEKRYHSLDYHLKHTYGEKLYKLALNGGMTCPNRDGTLGDRGCIFCSAGGSGDFAGNPRESIRQQIASGKEQIKKKTDAVSYIAYFQAYTNTYAEVSYLEKIFTEAISCPEVKILSIATRPDCLDDEILTLLARLNRIKPVWVELGLQTIHEQSARFIRRGYSLSVFEEAVRNLRQIGVEVIVHTILYLPGETELMMQETISYLNTMVFKESSSSFFIFYMELISPTIMKLPLSSSRQWRNTLHFLESVLRSCVQISSSTA